MYFTHGYHTLCQSCRPPNILRSAIKLVSYLYIMTMVLKWLYFRPVKCKMVCFGYDFDPIQKLTNSLKNAKKKIEFYIVACSFFVSKRFSFKNTYIQTITHQSRLINKLVIKRSALMQVQIYIEIV